MAPGLSGAEEPRCPSSRPASRPGHLAPSRTAALPSLAERRSSDPQHLKEPVRGARAQGLKGEPSAGAEHGGACPQAGVAQVR